MNFWFSGQNISLSALIEVKSGRNSRTGPGKSVRFKEVSTLECPLWRGFVIKVS